MLCFSLLFSDCIVNREYALSEARTDRDVAARPCGRPRRIAFRDASGLFDSPSLFPGRVHRGKTRTIQLYPVDAQAGLLVGERRRFARRKFVFFVGACSFSGDVTASASAVDRVGRASGVDFPAGQPAFSPAYQTATSLLRPPPRAPLCQRCSPACFDAAFPFSSLADRSRELGPLHHPLSGRSQSLSPSLVDF